MDNRISLSALVLAVVALIPCLAEPGEHEALEAEQQTFRDGRRGWLASERDGYWSPQRFQDADYRAAFCGELREPLENAPRGPAPDGAYVDLHGPGR